MNDSYTLSTVGVHMALLNSGKVLLFSGDDCKIWDWNRGASSLWDPNYPQKGEKRPTLKRNLFCCGHCFLPDGRLFVAGGQSTVHHIVTLVASFFGLLQIFVKGADHDIHTFDPKKEEWERHDNMPWARWYPTCVTLPDGRALVVSGTWSQVHQAFLARFKINAFINLSYEIFDPETNKLSEPMRFLDEMAMYPFLQVLPGGTLFVHYENTTTLWNLSTKTPYKKSFKIEFGGTRTYPGMGSCILLPLKANESKVRILMVGGSTSLHPNEDTPATDEAGIFEFDAMDPEKSGGWRKTKYPMCRKRFLTDSIILPDGTVMTTNGAARGTSDHNHEPVREIELFDPSDKDEKWRIIGSIDKDRLYHSTAVLLPDGRVVIAGSTGHKWPPTPEANEKAIEIVRPPYLSKNSQRPEIKQVQSNISYGTHFAISAVTDTDVIKSVILLRSSSTTHNNNMDQRYVELIFNRKNSHLLEVRSPVDGTFAPPGYYMLYLLDDERIPSIAKFIQVGK